MRPIRMNFKELTSDWIAKLEDTKWLKPIILEQLREKVAEIDEDVDESTRVKLLIHLWQKKLLTDLMAKTAKNWIL